MPGYIRHWRFRDLVEIVATIEKIRWTALD